LSRGSTEKRSQGGGRLLGLVLELLDELGSRPSGQHLRARACVLRRDLSRQIAADLPGCGPVVERSDGRRAMGLRCTLRRASSRGKSIASAEAPITLAGGVRASLARVGPAPSDRWRTCVRSEAQRDERLDASPLDRRRPGRPPSLDHARVRPRWEILLKARRDRS